MAGPFEQWTQRLRVSFLGLRGRALVGSFAAALGDRGIEWARQAVVEHHPELASAAANALTASERTIEPGPTETNASLGARLARAVRFWQLAGSPLGLLYALHYGGFPGAVIVQQNGSGFYLPISTIDLDNLRAAYFRVPLDVSPIAPGGPRPWWSFDFDDVWCSRFAVLFPGPAWPPSQALPPSATTWATATFTGVEDGTVANPWPLATWNNPFTSAVYTVAPGLPITAGGPVAVVADSSTQTTTGIRIAASAPFVGSVSVLAWQTAADNPLIDLHPVDLARLRRLIQQWRPAKAACEGIYFVAQGAAWGWPVGVWGGTTWDPSTVKKYLAQ